MLLKEALNELESSDGNCSSRGLYTTPKRSDACTAQLAANIYSLLGVAQFRAMPTQPEVQLIIFIHTCTCAYCNNYLIDGTADIGSWSRTLP